MRWKHFKTAFEWASNGWNILLFLFPSVGAIVSACSAYLAHEPWHMILFWATGTFCFLIVALNHFSSLLRQNTTFAALKLDMFSVLIVTDGKHELYARCSIKLINNSLFDLYYQLIDAELSLAGKTSPKNDVTNAVLLIQRQSDMTIQFSDIPGVKQEPMSGRMKLIIKYCKSIENLNHAIEFLAEPTVAIINNEKGEAIGAGSNFLVKSIKYT